MCIFRLKERETYSPRFDENDKSRIFFIRTTFSEISDFNLDKVLFDYVDKVDIFFKFYFVDLEPVEIKAMIYNTYLCMCVCMYILMYLYTYVLNINFDGAPIKLKRRIGQR
jgi:hypothetical protein